MSERRFTEDEVIEFLMNTHPGPLNQLDSVFPYEGAARDAWQTWIEHMESGGYEIGKEEKPA